MYQATVHNREYEKFTVTGKTVNDCEKKLHKKLKEYEFAGGYYTKVRRNYNVSNAPDEHGNFIELEEDEWDDNF